MRQHGRLRGAALACLVILASWTSSCQRTVEPSAARVRQLRERHHEQVQHVREHCAGPGIDCFYAGGKSGFLAVGMASNVAEALNLWHEKGAGLFVSEDDGQNWRRVAGLGDRRISSIAADGRQDVLYAATHQGILRSRDRGLTWEDFSAGLPTNGHALVYGLAVAEAGIVLAKVSGDGIGAYGTESAKAEWRHIGDELPGDGLPASAVVSDLCYSSRDRCAYALLGVGPVFVISGYRSRDMGIFRGVETKVGYRWKGMDVPYRCNGIEPFAAIGIDPNSGDLYAGGVAGVHELTSRGWRCVLATDFVSAVAFEKGTDRALVLTADGLMLRTGSQWARVSQTPWPANAVIRALQFNRGDMYVLTSDGLFVSRGKSLAWSSIHPPSLDTQALPRKAGNP